MSQSEKPSVFRSLLDKRRQSEVEAEPEAVEEETLALGDNQAVQPPVPEVEPLPTLERRKPGRPRGRRSNPDYTQISAYIPLELLLDIQEELAKEKRRLRSRSTLNVSELAENLLREWLQQRKGE